MILRYYQYLPGLSTTIRTASNFHNTEWEIYITFMCTVYVTLGVYEYPLVVRVWGKWLGAPCPFLSV